ncbi:MAG TPA: polysaccharide deacetylase family protein [Candidatus Limnocylindria bacterium]|nr:polysaccharide deacetylase family protein [Candidatus Limnocylindria bacterium]
MTRPLATVSVDVDPVDLHLLGYGIGGLAPDPLVYTASLPRLVERFNRTGVRATFFVVGRDAAAHAPALRALEDAGHEVASHSHSHPMPFVRVPRSRLDAELLESRRQLEDATGRPVIGFRAPNWDVSARAVASLVRAGYRYDASGFPTLLQIPARALLVMKAQDPRTALRMRPWPFTLRRQPFRWRVGGDEVYEFPISVTRWLGFPIYHTTRYLLPERLFIRHLDDFARRGQALFYPLHGVDALGLKEDRVDERLSRHPGMEHSLAHKLALLERSLAAIAERFEAITYREHLARLEAAEGTRGRPDQ